MTHNHPISDNLCGISTARKLTEEEKTIVRDMANAGTRAAPTLAYLRDKTGNQWTTRKEIYNEKVVAKSEFLEGRSRIQALYDEIRAGDFIFNVMVASDGALRGLFFCHEKSVELARRFNVVFVMDCTYKTNRFGMPLINIVGITASDSTSIVLASEKIWTKFQTKWRPNQDALVQYVHYTWLIHKEKIVRCCTGRFPHFGTTSTSRGEGNHFIVKRILVIVNNDLLKVFNKIRLLLDAQFT
ncbi:hypothetical protein PsorP6_007268 [Peronosclerospora sorghi]|uniref:Uncharacterized protein n=1 Tax=Peronosclerospora sorghi TaxID=230839 RepID=A0ACC0WA17_9STRA|nr:hypothetical protein PsorP6_007268 [Peronosclerospora sorghi]